MKLEKINGETVWVDKKPTPKSREKKEILHEEAMKQFNIENPEELYKNSHQKVIPKNWISEIIKSIIDIIETPKPSFYNYNELQTLFIFQFDGKEDSSKFYDQIASNFFKATNKFLRDKGLNPKDYYRSAILGTEVTDFQLTIKL